MANIIWDEEGYEIKNHDTAYLSILLIVVVEPEISYDDGRD